MIPFSVVKVAAIAATFIIGILITMAEAEIAQYSN
jgi:hypothetical protein